MVALIFCGDLKYCPYIKRYIERLEKFNIDYSVYFWNRGGYNLKLPNNYYYFDSASKLNKSKFNKLFDFIGYRKWVLDRLKSDKPNKIVALSTLTGVFLGKHLYKGSASYVFDIRDYSYEHINPFYRIEKKIIDNSAFTAISSNGFKAFLPEHEYIIAHNFNRNDISGNAVFRKCDGKIKFVWNGAVRYFDFQKKYLNALKNDERFQIIYHGDGPQLDLYKRYCEVNGFENVIFTGGYDNNDKAELLKSANILNNCYGRSENEGKNVKYAVSNRFYDGMIYHIPQLVEPEGFKTDWTLKSGIGCNIDADESFADRLYDYYMSIDEVQFNKACQNTLQEVLREDDQYVAMIDQFIK